jgi:hypothetical protein
MSESRDIWFRRVFLGYFPTHRKGLVALISGISLIVHGFLAGLLLADSHSVLSGGGYALAIGTFLALFVIANQHSGP